MLVRPMKRGPGRGLAVKLFKQQQASDTSLKSDKLRKPKQQQQQQLALIVMMMMNFLFTSWTYVAFIILAALGNFLSQQTGAVSVQKLNVPDLVVIDQLNQQQTRLPHTILATNQNGNGNNLAASVHTVQPEAASLINSQEPASEHQQITFECLISFDKRKDRNLIVKWHHEDRIEPIYQWIPELNKRSIAPQYRPYIAPIVPTMGSGNQQDTVGLLQQPLHSQNATNSNQVQLLEAGFRLVKPSKELGGKYTCSAISSQNDDSKWKKMIVYTPPRVFRFNASRTDIGALLANKRERLIHPSMIGPVVPTLPVSSSSNPNINDNFQLPLAYRMKGFEHNRQQQSTTISPQMYSTIDYVNVNQQRARQSALAQSSSLWVVGSTTSAPYQQSASTSAIADRHKFDPSSFGQSSSNKISSKQINGVKLVCDIDQVFPIPEVSIYKLAKLDGSHPDKLAKLDTIYNLDPITGLYHVQVTSILDDDELQMKYGHDEPVYFECLIALTNLELSKYADNKRSIVYRPGHLTDGSQTILSEDIKLDRVGNSASRSGNHNFILFNFIIAVASTYMIYFNQYRHHFTNIAFIS